MRTIRFAALRDDVYRLILSLMFVLILFFLSISSDYQMVELRFFDWLSTSSPPNPENTPVILVGIDEPSFRELGVQWPWDRKIHGALIEALTKAGASVIAMDIVFSEPSNFESDQAMAESIEKAPFLVLATEEVVEETAYVSQLLRIEPFERFSVSGAVSGVAALTLSKDSIIRLVPIREDGFAITALRQWLFINGLSDPGLPDMSCYLQYFGPPRSYPYVSYYQALDPEQFLPPGLFNNRIVIIGRAVKVSPEPERQQADAFSTPFTRSDGGLMAGIEIQATILDNLRLGLWVKPVPRYIVMIGLFFFVGLLYIFFNPWQPRRSAMAAFVLMAAVIAGSFSLLRFGRLWISPSLFILSVLLSYTGEGGLAFLKEQTGRRYIKQAFSRYLSPDLVEQLAADPSLLNLGGETRYMTIMFCDIRGFTGLSERYAKDSEGLVRVMNRFFSSMTAVIMKYGGTVDKYIGDCIMAFWNAPLEDPDHAGHACAAALEMLNEMQRLNEEFIDEAGGNRSDRIQLEIGIGMNTGWCVVGNIGSEQRFDYSVIGDPVNIASRLESQSKNYGTRIVIGKETAAAAAEFAILELDLMTVKGKSEAMNVFALIGGIDVKNQPLFQNLVIRHQQMLESYRKRDWLTAKEALSNCRDLFPDLNRLYELYGQRIDRNESFPPDKEWTGVYVSETK